jgi:ATP-dependent Clp protease ATP-binding subunit ClpB
MNPEKMTHKTQQALASAQSQMQERGHAELTSSHLLQALLAQADGVKPNYYPTVGGRP